MKHRMKITLDVEFDTDLAGYPKDHPRDLEGLAARSQAEFGAMVGAGDQGMTVTAVRVEPVTAEGI